MRFIHSVFGHGFDSRHLHHMKKLMLAAVLLLGVKVAAIGQSLEQRIDSYFRIKKQAPQELIVFGTNRQQDGYITAGYMVGEWGLYAGVPYNDKQILNRANGTVSKDMRFGILKQLQPNKLLLGAGVQPTIEGSKLNWFIGWNPLHSKDMKLLLIANVTGSEFSLGAGLSYRLK